MDLVNLNYVRTEEKFGVPLWHSSRCGGVGCANRIFLGGRVGMTSSHQWWWWWEVSFMARAYGNGTKLVGIVEGEEAWMKSSMTLQLPNLERTDDYLVCPYSCSKCPLTYFQTPCAVLCMKHRNSKTAKQRSSGTASPSAQEYVTTELIKRKNTSWREKRFFETYPNPLSIPPKQYLLYENC